MRRDGASYHPTKASRLVGYKLTGIHLVPVSPAQFSSGRISAISDRATNYLYGSPIYGASDFFSQGDRRHVAIGFDRSQSVRCRPSVLWLRSVCRRHKKVRLPALSNEFFEMSGVNMIRPTHGGEAIESPSPPALKGNWIKIRVKHNPACFDQIVDSPVTAIADPFNQECSVADLGKHPHPPVAADSHQPHRPQSIYRFFPPIRPQ